MYYRLKRKEPKMLDQINKAFAELDEKMHVSAVEFVKDKKENYARLYDEKNEELREKVAKRELHPRARHARLWDWELSYFGSQAMMNIIKHRSMQDSLDMAYKNVQGKIDRRNAQITNALKKKEVTEIPEFELVEYSNGLEGFFDVAGHKVHIRTILAGGYNIQCLHARTLINIK